MTKDDNELNDIYEIDPEDGTSEDFDESLELQESMDFDAVPTEPDDDRWTSDDGSGISFDNAASAVTSWATGAGVANDPFVRDFTSALRNRNNLTYWASVDLEEEFPEPVAGGRLRKAAKLLIILRNVAVFMPVGLTWWAISVVSPGFTAFANDRFERGEDANFFQYWTQVTFDVPLLPPYFFRIQHIAMVGSIIILLIILATVVAQFMNWMVERSMKDAMERRSQAIRAVRIALHSAREATPESLATSLAESMTELVESSRMIIDAARRLEQASVGVSQLEPTFQSLNEQLGRFDTRLGDTIIGSVDRLNASVHSLSSLMDGNLRALLTESVAGIDEVRQQLHRTAASVEFGTQQLLKDLGQIPSQARGGRPPGPSVTVPNGRV